MPLATLTHLEKTFGRRLLFAGLNLNVYRGERVGLIGDNGSGKTSLFRALVGELAPDAGTASVRKGARVGYLTQDPVFDPANSVLDEAELAFAQLHDLAHRMRGLEHDMADAAGDELERILNQYQVAQHEFELAGGYAWRHKLEATLLGIGLAESIWEQNVQTLSGGQRSRLALAKLLISEPDLLLLDEPTNHLDLAAIDWLEKYLVDFSGAVLLISHDRYLLDRLSTRIAWLSGGKIQSFDGNYSSYVSQRQLLELSQQRAYDKQREDIEKQKEFIRRFGAGQRSKEAKGREKRLNRLLKSDQLIQSVSGDKSIHLSLQTQKRAGDQVLDVAELTKSYGDKTLWRDAHFHVRRGERIGVIGPNGSGKTTLLEVLLGRRDAEAGRVRWGANLTLGYYDQNLDDLDESLTVFEQAAQGRSCPVQEIRDVLGSLLLGGTAADKYISMLSGGERARVRLAELLLDRPNVLLLDEPTNHLDIASREALEQTLAQFSGTILCVSHDRYFLDKTVGRLLVLDPPAVMDFSGNYSKWTASQTAATRASKIPPAPAKPVSRPAPAVAAPKKTPKCNPYTRPFGRLGTEELEKRITETEIALAECQSLLGDAEAYRDPAKSATLQAEYETCAQRLRQLEEEYFFREH